MTVAHELAGHYGLRAVLGEDYAPMMNAIYDGSEEVRKNVNARLQRNRDQVKNPNLRMTKEEAVEEYVAEKAEPDPKLKSVNRLVNAIKTFLRKIGFTIPVGILRCIRLIRDANKYTYGDAIKAAGRFGKLRRAGRRALLEAQFDRQLLKLVVMHQNGFLKRFGICMKN